MIQVMVVDDHEMVIEGMRNILARIEDVYLVATATSANDAMVQLKANAIDIAFIDINMPEVSGIELCLLIKKDFPKVHVIALSSFIQRSYVSQMIANGASGYLIKSAGKDEIEEAINSVINNKMFVSQNISMPSIIPSTEENIPTLTRREKEILQYISQGMTNKEIAEKIFVSQSTVDSHRKNLLAKFNVQNTASLITTAVKLGILV
ncbi:MAG: response regulator transcription factor [Bacteroidetes bacterium]|nr:response regulator transcription factor [Bacteroidota bacterium]MBL0052215.1 response regulator transcription factor [Bacteroidota bacterium]